MEGDTLMKLYALKYKDEYVEFALNEWQLEDNYKFENAKLKDSLVIVEGTFTEISI